MGRGVKRWEAGDHRSDSARDLDITACWSVSTSFLVPGNSVETGRTSFTVP